MYYTVWLKQKFKNDDLNLSNLIKKNELNTIKLMIEFILQLSNKIIFLTYFKEITNF